MKQCLVIACSPFQIICALECIAHFKINIFDFIIPTTNKKQRNHLECKNILEKEGINFVEIDFYTLKQQLQYYIKKSNHKYETIICGDYFDINQRMLLHMSSRSNSKIVFVDDGNSTLKGFEKDFSFWKQVGPIGKSKLIIQRMLCNIKDTNVSYFSIFESSQKKQIIKNDFSHLKNNSIETSSQGIYILGTVTTFLNPILVDTSIEQEITTLVKYFKKLHPSQDIYYCPHRRDKFNEKLSLLLEDERVIIFNTDISVEVDFLRKNISPLYIIGFGSTALFTLKKIYNKANVYTIPFITKDEKLNLEYKLIEQKYSENGITLFRTL